jgi:pimeloyl-ACP methyl ester carboxylesterase
MDTTSKSEPIDGMEEHILTVPDGRQLAYAHNGNPSSRKVVVFFPGLFGVGTARDVPEPMRSVQAHWISLTLPGMGNTSSTRPGVPYCVNLARDVSALLNYLHPGGIDQLFVAGGSYGTVAAQMIYGAPYDIFPQGRSIAGCLIAAGFSPFKYHKDYAKSLIWPNYISVGPPSQIVPLRLVQRLLRSFLASKLSTIEGAERFLRDALFDKMDGDERAMFDKYLVKQGEITGQFIRNMAETVIRSTNNWDGFMEVSDVLHSDWGFVPNQLDDEHARKPILIVGSDKDELGNRMNEWLVQNYKAAHSKQVAGGHISALFYQDELWVQMLELAARNRL